jgi:hypothetical protein
METTKSRQTLNNTAAKIQQEYESNGLDWLKSQLPTLRQIADGLGLIAIAPSKDVVHDNRHYFWALGRGTEAKNILQAILGQGGVK